MLISYKATSSSVKSLPLELICPGNGQGINIQDHLSISTDNITEFNRLQKQYYDTGNSLSLKNFLYNTAVVNFESKNVPVNVPVNVLVNSTEQAVLDIIKHNPSVTYDDIAIKIGKTRKTVSRAINSLKQKGIIFRSGSDKSGHWVIL